MAHPTGGCDLNMEARAAERSAKRAVRATGFYDTVVAADPTVPAVIEVRFAYATAVAASFAWVACVMPGVRLADASLADDLATTMHRGAVYLVPALFLLVAIPIAAVIAREAVSLRGLLAWSAVFASLYAAVVMMAGSPRPFRWIVAGGLLAIAAVSVRDALRIGRAASSEPPAELSPRAADVRLALSLLALLTPAGLLVAGGEERATWLMPFAFVAIGAAGERWSRGLRGLRLATTLSLVLLAAHLLVGVLYTLDDVRPRSIGWSGWGVAAMALSALILALVVGWTTVLAVLMLRGRRAPAPGVAS
jgi:hypothetical protein